MNSPFGTTIGFKVIKLIAISSISAAILAFSLSLGVPQHLSQTMFVEVSLLPPLLTYLDTFIVLTFVPLQNGQFAVLCRE